MIVTSKDAKEFQVKDSKGRLVGVEMLCSIMLTNPDDEDLEYIVDVTEELYNNIEEGHTVKMYDVFLQYKGTYERRLLKRDDKNIEKYMEQVGEVCKESKSDILKRYQECNNKNSGGLGKVYALFALLMVLLFLMASYVNS